MPESYDAWQRHDDDAEAWLESRPVCEECKEHIQDEYLFDIGGVLYCEGCAEKLFRKDSEKY